MASWKHFDVCFTSSHTQTHTHSLTYLLTHYITLKHCASVSTQGESNLEQKNITLLLFHVLPKIAFNNSENYAPLEK